MLVLVQPDLEHRGMSGSGVTQLREVRTRDEEERESELVGLEADELHAVVEGESEAEAFPGGGESADHDVEGVLAGIGDVAEERRRVFQVLEADGFGEKEAALVMSGVGENSSVDSLQFFDGIA